MELARASGRSEALRGGQKDLVRNFFLQRRIQLHALPVNFKREREREGECERDR